MAPHGHGAGHTQPTKVGLYNDSLEIQLYQLMLATQKTVQSVMWIYPMHTYICFTQLRRIVEKAGLFTFLLTGHSA